MNSSPSHIRMALAQINCLVGDVWGNTEKIIRVAQQALRQAVDLVIYPELALTGYPPEDLLFRAALYEQVEDALLRIQTEIRSMTLIIGHPARSEKGPLKFPTPSSLAYNAATIIQNGKRIATYFKQCLPNYHVFDERRYFAPGHSPCVFLIKGFPFGVTICEDLWEPHPIQQSKHKGAECLININASPYHLGKYKKRLALLTLRAQETNLPIVYNNLVGGQDELIFDGHSLIVNAKGQLVAALPPYQALVEIIDFNPHNRSFVPRDDSSRWSWGTATLSDEDSVYGALLLSIRDYVHKNKFKQVVLGLSGGMDSALTLVIAVDALGHENVEAVMMPSKYTSAMSVEDARILSKTLEVEYHEYSIDSMFQMFMGTLKERFASFPTEITEQNIQARCRATLLMAISNKMGKLVLTTSNKSELAVGYSTLYGDMAGGFCVLKDITKTWVYRLAHYRNHQSPVIPKRIIERAPSAELAPEQKDEDSLPPYSKLDPLLTHYIEENMDISGVVKKGFDPSVVERVIAMVQRNEYKRAQAPPGPRITEQAFGKDWRYPITSGYREKK
ncbi:MAG: NAD+ synthase [Gammaproteobacteria bacterium]|nr:NAD+ synthase [Gammaproteobacteria bacterium]